MNALTPRAFTPRALTPRALTPRALDCAASRDVTVTLSSLMAAIENALHRLAAVTADDSALHRMAAVTADDSALHRLAVRGTRRAQYEPWLWRHL